MTATSDNQGTENERYKREQNRWYRAKKKIRIREKEIYAINYITQRKHFQH